MAMPRVMIYVQHLLGVGHLHRVSAIARSMARGGFETTLVSGGMPDTEQMLHIDHDARHRHRLTPAEYSWSEAPAAHQR